MKILALGVFTMTALINIGDATHVFVDAGRCIEDSE